MSGVDLSVPPGGDSPNSHCMNIPLVNSPDLVQVRLQHTPTPGWSWEPGGAREHIVVAMVTDLVILMKSLRESENPKIITLLCTYVLLILAIIIPPP